MLRSYVEEVSGSLTGAEKLLLSALLVLGVGMTWGYIFFAGILGFDVHPEFQVVLLLVLFLTLPVLTWLGRRVMSGNAVFHRARVRLIIVLVVTFVLRLFYALYASLFPDEYWAFLVLSTHPLHDLAYFFSNYTIIASRYATHPPLAFLIMSLAYEIFPSPISVRFVSVILGTASVALVYFVVRELGGERYALPVAALYGVFPQTLLFLSVALTDVYMIFFGLLSFLLGLKSMRPGKAWYALLSGIFLGMSLLSKQDLGIFWWALLLVAAFLVKDRRISLIRGLASALLALFPGLAIFSVWYLLNPGAFLLTVVPVIRYMVTVSLDPRAYDLGQCCFQYVNGMLTHISYADLLVQLPVWLTPVVTVLGLVGMGIAVRRHQKKDAWWIFWVVGPLLAMIPGIRDIRYTLFITPAAAYFAWMGASKFGWRVRRTALGLMIIFVVLFISITATVAQQQYWGVQEASAEITKLGLGTSVVLTNVPETLYTLPQARIIILPWYYNWTQVDRIIRTENVTAILIVRNSRAPWPIPSPQTMNGMGALFARHESNAISDFASYEIFYDRQ
jgi:4-amino-4-deoxy-L-arabinose transferase-like glycosyltransferase